MSEGKEILDSASEIVALREEVKVLTVKIEKLESRVAKLEQKPSGVAPNIPTHSHPTFSTLSPIPAGEKMLWKKVGGGSLRLGNGKIIKPSETFMAAESELPKLAIKNKFVIPVGGEVLKKEEEPIISKTGYELKEKGVGWYDVINLQTQKPVNEKSLRKKEAEELLADLT